MRTAALAALLICASGAASAQLRLSFVGYSATSEVRSVGSFDEAVQDSLVIDTSGMWGYGPDGWYLSWSSVSHYKNGYPALPDTEAWTACGGGGTPTKHDVILWLEPGQFMLGQQVPFRSGDDRVAFVYGDDWGGHAPWEFTHLRVVLVGQTGETFQGPFCLSTYLIPIVWQQQPVPAESSTFGKIKALYRSRGE